MDDGNTDGSSTTTTTSDRTHTTSSRGSSRAPPVLDDKMTYEMWKKQLQLWQICSRLDKDQQASELILSLSGKAREAALEMDITEIHVDDGVDNVIKKLDGLFLKDENQLIYVSLKKFEHYKIFYNHLNLKILFICKMYHEEDHHVDAEVHPEVEVVDLVVDM